MLSLLSTTDAALVVYYTAVQNDWQLAFDPMNKQEILKDEKKRIYFLMYQTYIQNAIQSGELPAMQKPKGKSADKKLFEKLDIPRDMLEAIPQYDYWITQEDLFVFMERTPVISKDYTHGRDALARLLCALIDKDALNEKDINEYLAHKIETAEKTTLNAKLKIGDNTLKGCCREILDTLTTIKSADSKK